MVGVNVPFVSQIGPGATGAYDCGQTCVAMLMRYALGVEVAPDELSAIHAGYTNAGDLVDLAGRHGLALRREVPFTSVWDSYMLSGKLLEMLRAGTPPVVLFSYPKLGPGFTSRYGGYHWMIVTGFEDGEWRVNDPLDDEAGGKDKPVSVARFRQAVVGWVEMLVPVVASGGVPDRDEDLRAVLRQQQAVLREERREKALLQDVLRKIKALAALPE